MTCFAVGHLREVEMGPEIVAYLEGIDATLAPYEGRYLIHGGEKHMLEGAFKGDLIVIAFPDRKQAEAWYRSPAYQKVLPKRLARARGEVFLIDGVDADHKATDVLK
ncbi:DUF1330 domain-containing protein [Roseibium sp.]|uniref:DUF1330 domain-containing protein n=1 Tax=Roseibium sp. TaxID=1936156 RepID=UPI003D1153D0